MSVDLFYSEIFSFHRVNISFTNQHDRCPRIGLFASHAISRISDVAVKLTHRLKNAFPRNIVTLLMCFREAGYSKVNMTNVTLVPFGCVSVAVYDQGEKLRLPPLYPTRNDALEILMPQLKVYEKNAVDARDQVNLRNVHL